MKRITNKRWFGPKIVGYGPAPKSWEGWVGILSLDSILSAYHQFIEYY